MSVLIETSQGDIVVDLYVEEQAKCCLNFLKLCKLKYYNYTLIHTVQRNFIAQAGDPTGTGEGGESVWGVIKGEDYRYFEAVAVPHMKHQKLGTVSMVNNGQGCYGSQFLITLGEGLDILDGKHTVFGEVAEGEDVLMKLNEAYCDKEGRPYQDIRIYHTVVLEDPYDDPEGLVVPDRSPSPPSVVTDSNRIGAEEDIDEFKGKTEEEIKELVGLRESKANAQILEMVGDIPDADARPPENVLFVCKLNPVTTAEDLEIIFSRFGPIQSCEVIQDHKTGDSLQYAFIEFENEEDCVNAYFKMDNVLVDDRRIHVDFSQSLAKVKGIHKRKSSETQPSGRKDDGFVAKQKPKGDDGYEMVFEDTEVRPAGKKRKRHDDDSGGSDSERRYMRHKGREGETSRERKEKKGHAHTRWHSASEDEHHREHKNRDREERRREREKERGGGRKGREREEERGAGRRGREKEEERGREREKERRRGREEERRRDSQRNHRSRSRSRDRHHKHSRDRSRSHERRYRH